MRTTRSRGMSPTSTNATNATNAKKRPNTTSSNTSSTRATKKRKSKNSGSVLVSMSLTSSNPVTNTSKNKQDSVLVSRSLTSSIPTAKKVKKKTDVFSKKCYYIKNNKISSFASAYIRNWINTQQHVMYGEIGLKELDNANKDNTSVREDISKIYTNYPNEIAVTGVEEVVEYIREHKYNIKFIIKVLRTAPSSNYTKPNKSKKSNKPEAYKDYGLYGSHWYFATSNSPIDDHEFIRKEAGIGKNHEIVDTGLMNSYFLQWQATATNQFCMLYALYGIYYYDENYKREQKSIFKKLPVIDAKLLNEKKGNFCYNHPVQNNNTGELLSWFLGVLGTYKTDDDLIADSIEMGTKTYHGKYTKYDIFSYLKEGIETPEKFLPSWI